MFLGLDLGTSGLRAVLVNADGGVVATAEANHDVMHRAPGWSEQDPADWITSCQTAMSMLRETHGAELAETRAIGLSGHMHGATLVGADDTVLRPCILWNDTRSAAQAQALDRLPDVRAVSGNIVFPGFTAPKLRWVEEKEPEIFDKIAKVHLPKDYLRLWLTGEHAAEMSDAAGTSWLDVGARIWSDQLLRDGHMRLDQMPGLVEGTEVAGDLRDLLRNEWGMTHRVVVAGGGGDNAAAACGVGCMNEGQGFVSLGTSGVLLTARDSFAPDPETAVHTFCHAVPEKWYQMGVTLAATDCLNWLAKTVSSSPQYLADALPDVIDGPTDLLFLPYLSGERTPHNDANMRGAFIGLDIASGTKALTQAVMEGVCFSQRDSLQALRSTGAQLDSVLAIGGGTRSRFWLESLASTLGLPLQIPTDGEFGAAMGAARLGMAAAGLPLEQVMTRPHIAETIDPRPNLTEVYDNQYARYRALYPNIKAALT